MSTCTASLEAVYKMVVPYPSYPVVRTIVAIYGHTQRDPTREECISELWVRIVPWHLVIRHQAVRRR